MSRFLGLGMTHYPMLAGADTHMAGLLGRTLTDPDIPDSEKDPANWPASMRDDWSDDHGATAAASHRKVLVENLARCREALDEFRPDVVVVWGDDQYENFREEIIPPFCVLAYEDVEVEAFAILNKLRVPNIWHRPADSRLTVRGDAEEARRLADALIVDGFDMAYSYKKREDAPFPHAILNTQLFLDYDNAGTAFPYPFVPITVNCYGRHVIARKGGLASYADIRTERLDPPAPTPRRCFDLGRAVARACRDGDRRVAFIASSSWSHAFLNDKGWHLRPDTPADQHLYDALVRSDFDAWNAIGGDEIASAGQQELLNWYCLLGAMAELDLPLAWSTLVTTDVFNSNKCFAIYGQDQA